MKDQDKKRVPHSLKKTGAARRAKEIRRQEHEQRVLEYRKLSTKEKIAKLDAKLGRGAGAKRQRLQLVQEAGR